MHRTERLARRQHRSNALISPDFYEGTQMNLLTARSPFTRRQVAAFAVALAVGLAAFALPEAQTVQKKAITIDDYTKWRRIATQEISADGKWVVYTLELTNTIPAEAKPVLHLLNLETGVDVTVADATSGSFSADSKWLAYQVDPGAAQRARAGRGGSGSAAATGPAPPQATPPAQPGAAGAPGGQGGRGGPAAAIPPRRVELRNRHGRCARGGYRDVRLSATSTHMFLRRRGGEAAPAAGGRAGAPGGQPPSGAGQPRRCRTRGAARSRRHPAGSSDRPPAVARQRR
jgi:hypothetical protein